MKFEELINKIKISKLISIRNKNFSVKGYKDIILENGEKLLKIRLERGKQFFWLELQFAPRDKIILWKEIKFYPSKPFPRILKYNNKNFELIDKGISDIKVATGAVKSFENEKIHWWDYQAGTEMLSLGLLENNNRWENLFGKIINIKDLILE